MMLAFRVIWLLFCGIAVATCGDEVMRVKIKEEYKFLFGGEGPTAGLWHYSSENAYLFYMACQMLWFFAGVWLCLSLGHRPFRRKLLFAHFCLSVLWLILVKVTLMKHGII